MSVIIPTCNRRDLLGRCLKSVLKQTKLPLEIIVVNDAGESAEDIIEEHNTLGLIRYLAHASNQGASAARNTGLKVARGDYIAYLDDDDTYLPAHLEIVLKALRASTCRFAYSQAEYVIDDLRDGQIVNIGRVRPYSDIPYSRDRLLVNNFIPTPTWVFERTLLNEVGCFDEYFGACEDWEWLIRASERTGFLTIPDITVEVRQRLHDDQHLIVQHRPQMGMWIRAVYAKHPVTSAQLQLARHELLTFGAAKQMSKAQESVLAMAFETAQNGDLDLISLINTAEILNSTNLRNRTIFLYQIWLEHNAASPLRYAALFNLAVSFKNLGIPSEAEKVCRQSLDVNPRFNTARFFLASLLVQQNQAGAATKIWHTIAAEETSKDTPDYQLAMHNIASHAENSENAVNVG